MAVKLPELLAYVKIEEETSIRLQQKLVEFLKYELSILLLNFGYDCLASTIEKVAAQNNLVYYGSAFSIC